MVISTESARDLAAGDVAELFVKEYDDAFVYGDVEGDAVLHEGDVRVLANGWVELPTGRLLSPSTVHHVDPKSEPDN